MTFVCILEFNKEVFEILDKYLLLNKTAKKKEVKEILRSFAG